MLVYPFAPFIDLHVYFDNNILMCTTFDRYLVPVKKKYNMLCWADHRNILR